MMQHILLPLRMIIPIPTVRKERLKSFKGESSLYVMPDEADVPGGIGLGKETGCLLATCWKEKGDETRFTISNVPRDITPMLLVYYMSMLLV